MPRYDLAGNLIPDDPNEPPVQFDLSGNPIDLAQRESPQENPTLGYGHQQFPGYGNHTGAGHAGNPYISPRQVVGSAEQLMGPRGSDGLMERILANSSGALGDVPVEVQQMRWNWGAFLLPSFWAFNHGLRWLSLGMWIVGVVLHFCSQMPSDPSNAVGVAYTVTCLGVSVWLGLCGNPMAWRFRRFEGGLDDFKEVQRIWMYAGIGVALISVILFGGKLTPGIALYRVENITRPVNSQRGDYELMYGHRPPLFFRLTPVDL